MLREQRRRRSGSIASNGCLNSKCRADSCLPGTTALEQFGISDWSRGRDWRATGFFNHWVTYAEVLQLIASLALGLFLAFKQKKNLTGLLLLLAVGGFVFALGDDRYARIVDWFRSLGGVMLLLTSSRRTILIVGACAIPLVLAGECLLLQQKRSIGFIDKAGSIDKLAPNGLAGRIRSPRQQNRGISLLASVSTRSKDTGVSGACLTTVANRSATCTQTCCRSHSSVACRR